MSFSISAGQRRFSNVALTGIALALCGGSLQAAIVSNSGTLALFCDTVLGPTPATVGIKLSAAGSAVVVTATAPTPPVVLSTAPTSVGSAVTFTNFTFTLAPGCKGAVNNGTQTLTFTPAGGTAITVVATFTVTNGATALAPSPSAVTITCNLTTGTYTPGSAQTVKVTSPAFSGTPFTVDNVTNPLPSWLLVTPLTGGTASATAVSLNVVAATGCGGLSVGSTTFVVHLLNAPAPDKLLPVTIQVGGASPLSASVSPIALTYTTGTTPSSSVTTNIGATAAFFTVVPGSLPVWLNVTPTFGSPVTGVPVTLTFAVTTGAKTLAPGGYSASVHLQVSGDLDFVVPVTLQVVNPGASLTISDAVFVSSTAYTKSINWTLGTTLPSFQITPVSSDAPIAFAVTTTAGTLSPQVNVTSGLAYSFGSPITVTFLQSVFGALSPGGTAPTGAVVITPAGGSPITVTITVNVKSPGPVITSLSPASLPTATSGTFPVALSGSGFVVSGSPTIVGIVTGGLIFQDSNISVVVSNSTTIQLAITVPGSPDPNLPFSGLGGTVTLGVCNPQPTTCSTPNSTIALVIGVNPVIQAVISAASFVQTPPPALTPVAPYDILSIFGTDFCISGGTGCTSANLYGALNPVTLGYLSTLSPDAAGATQRNLSVAFQTHGRSPTLIANAPLLFANNNQINLVVPDEVKPYIGQTVDIVVNFGYGTTTNLLSSTPYSVTITATDPGVFSTSGDGQGQAAALSLNYALVGNTSSNTVGLRNNGTDSDIIQLYVAGLGKPDSAGGSQAYPTPLTCQTVEGYWAAVNAATGSTLTSNDGLVIQVADVPSGNLPPCVAFASADQPTVTIGTVPATVLYAGWVFGTVAGLYQINVQLPISTTTTFTDASGTVGAVTHTAQNMPVVVTANGLTSQPSGLNLWVQQKLLMTVTGALTGAHSPTAWPGTTITATDGAVSPTITYALTSANLPAGLAFSTSTGVISGTATSAGTTVLVITATDSVSGCTGVATVTLVIT